MHTVILGVALVPAGVLGALPADCPARGAPVIERFAPADCVACWRVAAGTTGGKAHWRLDWIVPVAGDPPGAAEAAEREARARRAGVTPRDRQSTLPRDAALAVSSGPAWHGYLGVQIDVAGSWPAGASAWLALVEALPAGADGIGTERVLVRAVAGPLALPGSHLHALRWPETVQPERLAARGWIESADGRILALASPTCPLR
jgi:hypothetical protein